MDAKKTTPSVSQPEASGPPKSEVSSSQKLETPSSLKAFEDAYCEYMTSLEKAWCHTQERILAAQQTFQRALHDAMMQSEPYTRMEDARKEYMRSCESIFQDSQKRYEESYHSYLRAFQKAWTSTDLSTVDLWGLTIIGRSAESACMMTANLIGSFHILKPASPASTP